MGFVSKEEMIEDEFVRLKDYPNYGVSKDGRVYSYKSKIVMKPIENGRGYLQVQFVRPKWKSVHRLVAETFIPNPFNLPEINHIDKNRSNNNVNNLEWCTHHYNVIYSKAHGVIRINPISGSIMEYESIAEAARQSNMMRSQITRCCMGKMKKSHGYYWEYRKEEEECNL